MLRAVGVIQGARRISLGPKSPFSKWNFGAENVRIKFADVNIAGQQQHSRSGLLWVKKEFPPFEFDLLALNGSHPGGMGAYLGATRKIEFYNYLSMNRLHAKLNCR